MATTTKTKRTKQQGRDLKKNISNSKTTEVKAKAKKAVKTSRTKKKPIAKTFNRHVTVKWDYEEAKLWYISNSTVTQAMVAEKYGVHPASVARRAVEDNWAEAKTNYSQTLEREATANAKATVRKMLDRQLKEAQSVSVIGANSLHRIWDEVKETKKKPNIKEVLAAARALEVGHKLERTALGLPTHYNGFADKDGNSVDPSVNLNVVTFQQFIQETLDRAVKNGVIDAESE